MLEMIAARGANGVIGNAGGMPWHLPEDLKHFKTVTMGATVLMGRKTFESIGRALPGRRNIVITRRTGYLAPGCEVVGSLEAALRETRNDARVFVIGGGEVYRAALPCADRLWLTEIDASPEGDTTFPALNPSDWDAVLLSELPGTENRPGLRFMRYERKPR